MDGEPWVVWSFEHGAWWAPGRMGYVREIARAGRYTREDAEAIERAANYPPGRMNEWAMPQNMAERIARRDEING